MKTTTRRTFIAVTAVAAAALSTAARAGVVDYSFDTPQTTVAPGDTVTVTVNALIDPQDSAFVALAAAEFDIMINDIAAGGTTDISSPGLGLTPDFLSGDPGVIVDNDVLDVTASQLPPMINPAINTGTELTLYHFNYTIDDSSPRTITIDLANMTSIVYGNETGSVNTPYSSTSSPLELTVSSVPAPGALALLGIAGLLSRRRRR